MFAHVDLYLSRRNIEANKELALDVENLRSRGVDVDVYGSPEFMEESIELPSVYTDEGHRAYGVAAIKRLIRGRLAKADQSQ